MPDGIGLRSTRGPALLAMLVATFLVGAAATAISTAVPSIVADIGGFSSFPWLFSVYLVAMTVTVPVFSKLADTLGRRRLLLFGVCVFVIGSVLCGLAWDMPSLIAFRVVQGIGGGSLQPLALTVIGDIYTKMERARVQRYIAVTGATASVAGPAIGGVFALMDAWRLVFLINLPLGALTAWLIYRSVHEQFERRRHRVDYAGAVLLTVSLSLLILGVLEGGDAWEWSSPTSLLIFSGGGALLVAFLVRQHFAAEPIIPLGLFRRRLIIVMTVLGLMMGAIMVGLTVFVPTYLQVAAGTSPILAGAAVAAMSIGLPVSSAIAGVLSLRIGLRFTTVLGAGVTLVGGSGLAVFAPHPSALTVAGFAALVGIGFGLTTVPGLVALQESVAWDQRGVVTGMVTFFRSLGQALGAASLGAVAKSILSADPGVATGEQDPLTMQATGSAVFLVVVGFALVHLVAALCMPTTRHPLTPSRARPHNVTA
ncbi:MDR family MFS transporter [Okibacterium endophyticum]